MREGGAQRRALASPVEPDLNAESGAEQRRMGVADKLEALASEAEYGLAFLRKIERHCFAVRRAVAFPRRDASAIAAIDILAAAPLVSPTSLAQLLGIAIKNATGLLDGFIMLGIVSEPTHRSKRRLYGLKHLPPLREAAAPPRRPLPDRGRGRPTAKSVHTIQADIVVAGPR